MSTLNDLFTLSEAAEFCGISEEGLRRVVQRGYPIPGLIQGRRTRRFGIARWGVLLLRFCAKRQCSPQTAMKAVFGVEV